ncbi:hypothetical protein AB2M62_05475 [Sphingomonas sp. MMS12-HWE2-04]
MSNDFEGSAWADHHHHVSHAIAHLIDTLLEAFEALVAIEYDAPWDACRH